MQLTIDTSLTQLFAGTRLPIESACTHCDHPFDAGDRCILHATRPEDVSAYTLEGLYCPNCAPETVLSPTFGRSEHLLAARLTGTANCESLMLSAPQLIQTSAPSEGSATTDGLIALLPTAELPELTNTTYHFERADEQQTPLCNCSSNTEYTRIAVTDLETPSAHCCRTCRSIYQNEHETHLPCDTEHRSLRQDPHHAQIGTADSPTDAPVIRKIQRARRSAPPTSVHAYQE